MDFNCNIRFWFWSNRNGKTVDDEAEGERTGGFGSTDDNHIPHID